MNQEVIPWGRGLLAGIWPNQVPAVQGFYLGFAYGKINIPAIPRPWGVMWLQMTGALYYLSVQEQQI